MAFLWGFGIAWTCFGFLIMISACLLFFERQHHIIAQENPNEEALPLWIQVSTMIRKYIGRGIPIALAFLAVLVADLILILKQINLPWLLLPVIFFSFAFVSSYSAIYEEIISRKMPQKTGKVLPSWLVSLHLHQKIASALFWTGTGVITLLITPKLIKMLSFIDLDELGYAAEPGGIIVLLGILYWLSINAIRATQEEKREA